MHSPLSLGCWQSLKNFSLNFFFSRSCSQPQQSSSSQVVRQTKNKKQFYLRGDNNSDHALGDPGVPTEVGNLDDHPGEVHSLLDRVAEDADYLLEVTNSKWVCRQPENLAEDQLQVLAAKVFEQLEGSHMEDKAHWLAVAAHFH